MAPEQHLSVKRHCSTSPPAVQLYTKPHSDRRHINPLAHCQHAPTFLLHAVRSVVLAITISALALHAGVLLDTEALIMTPNEMNFSFRFTLHDVLHTRPSAQAASVYRGSSHDAQSRSFLSFSRTSPTEGWTAIV